MKYLKLILSSKQEVEIVSTILNTLILFMGVVFAVIELNDHYEHEKFDRKHAAFEELLAAASYFTTKNVLETKDYYERYQVFCREYYGISMYTSNEKVLVNMVNLKKSIDSLFSCSSPPCPPEAIPSIFSIRRQVIKLSDLLKDDLGRDE